MVRQGLRALLWVVAVLCAVSAGSIASVGVVADGGAAGAALQEDPAERTQLEDADEIHIDIFLTENGSATFEVEYRYFLEGEDNATEWEALRSDVESNPDAYAATEAEGWNETRAEAENATDREMEISNVSVTTDEDPRPRELGRVEFRFEWSSFAHVVMNEIQAGDSLSGFPLVDDTTLQLIGPEGYVVHDVDPTPDSSEPNAVLWNGEGTEFTDEQPRVVMIENGDGEPTTDADNESSVSWPGSGSWRWLAVLAALALLATVGAVGWWVRHSANGAAAAADDGTRPVADGSSSEASEGPPPELLSNEERVLRLLEERGGRIKQQEVVSQLDWTEAKTSQVVSGLRENDEIDVFRIGRENVLALPDDRDEE